MFIRKLMAITLVVWSSVIPYAQAENIVPGTAAVPTAVITKILPDAPVAGEKLQIIGSNFDVIKGCEVIIKYKNALGEVTLKKIFKAETENYIEYILPDDLINNDVSISIKNDGTVESNIIKISISKKNIKDQPSAIISEIFPMKAYPGDTIKISGDKFDTKNNSEIFLKYTSEIGDVLVTNSIKANSEKLINFTIPEEFDGSQNVYVAIKNKGSSESNKQEISIEDNNIAVNFKVGLQTSTLTSSEEENEKLFHGNKLFYDIVAKMHVCKYSDFETRLHIGRKVVEGEQVKTAAQNPQVKEIIKNAEIAEGDFSLYLYIPHGFYVRPAVSFIATTDKEIKDDFFFEKFLGVGYEPLVGKSNKFRGSKVEMGYGHSDALESKNRFISCLKVVYHAPSISPVPYINFKINTGRGADDLTVFYGVDIDTEKIFKSIQDVFTEKEASPATPPEA